MSVVFASTFSSLVPLIVFFIIFLSKRAEKQSKKNVQKKPSVSPEKPETTTIDMKPLQKNYVKDDLSTHEFAYNNDLQKKHEKNDFYGNLQNQLSKDFPAVTEKFSKNNLQNAIVMSEILGPPRALRKQIRNR